MKFFFACISLVLFLASTNLVEAQVPGFGGCPKVTLQEDLKLDRYMGKWYEHSAYNFLIEAGGSCIYVTYSDLKNDTFTLTDTQVNKIKALETITAPVKYLGAGQFDLQIDPIKSIFISRDYNVLYTDYDGCAVIYMCRDLRLTHGLVMAILTRERNPSAEVVQKCKDKMTEQNLSLHKLKVTQQENCTN